MKKIIFGITVLVIGLTITFLLAGVLSDRKFAGSLVAEYNSSSDKIWQNLTNISDLPNRRKEISGIEILEKDDKNNPKKWKEYTDMSGYIIFEVAAWEEGKYLKLKMVESTFGMSGEWAYTLEKISDGKTKVTFYEDSTIDSFSVRAIMTIFGRDGNLKKEKENLDLALVKSN